MRKDLEVFKVVDAHSLLGWKRPHLFKVMVVRSHDTEEDPVVLTEIGTDVGKLVADLQIEKRDEMAVNEARVIRQFSSDPGFLSLVERDSYDHATHILAWALWENGVVFYGEILKNKDNLV